MGGSAVSVLTLTTAFKSPVPARAEPVTLDSEKGKTAWAYHPVDPAITAERAYLDYSKHSCMYAIFNSVLSQLAESHGEPYASFPTAMMLYGHGGIGGYGTVCGALNGAAALFGLFVGDKKMQNHLIENLFRWYEETELPRFDPESPGLDYTPPASSATLPLCHASITHWVQTSGYEAKSAQRKERCRRLSADVAAQAVTILNQYFSNTFTTAARPSETVSACMTCHGDGGKLANTNGMMHCAACHPKSLGHRLFADIHYKMMQ